MSPPEIPRGLPRRQANLLAALVRQSSLTRREYQLLAGISHNTARRDLAELIARNLVVPCGSARASRYALSLARASQFDAE